MMTTKAATILTLFALGALAQSTEPKNIAPASPPRRRLRRRQLVHEEGRKQQVDSDKLAARDLQERCILDGNLYGAFEGRNRNVQFLYQAVFSEGTSQTQIRLNIMPFLEREIVEGILPSFFDCPEADPTGSISGVSPSDADLLTVGGDGT